jgi:hypothetical protein
MKIKATQVKTHVRTGTGNGDHTARFEVTLQDFEQQVDGCNPGYDLAVLVEDWWNDSSAGTEIAIAGDGEGKAVMDLHQYQALVDKGLDIERLENVLGQATDWLVDRVGEKLGDPTWSYPGMSVFDQVEQAEKDAVKEFNDIEHDWDHEEVGE